MTPLAFGSAWDSRTPTQTGHLIFGSGLVPANKQEKISWFWGGFPSGFSVGFSVGFSSGQQRSLNVGCCVVDGRSAPW
jgi:hypothetical protein